MSLLYRLDGARLDPGYFYLSVCSKAVKGLYQMMSQRDSTSTFNSRRVNEERRKRVL